VLGQIEKGIITDLSTLKTVKGYLKEMKKPSTPFFNPRIQIASA
jgi:hypothetical protein